MVNCAIAGCTNYTRRTKGTNIEYFRFPKQDDIAKQWVVACRREDKINLKNASICSEHFLPECFEIPLRQRLLNCSPKNARILKEGALPSLKLPLRGTLDRNAGSERSDRITKWRRKKKVVPEQPSTSTATSDQEIGEYDRHINRDTSDTADMIKHQNNDDKIKQLEEKIALLQEENQLLLRKIGENDSKERNIKDSLQKIFSPGQIKRLLNPEKKFSRWSPEDIASAISLRSVSPKAYKYLRTNGYPLPALSTLRTWAATFDLKPGLLKGVCSLLKGTVMNLSSQDKLCVLSFDEMYVSNRIDIEKKQEEKIGPHKNCQTVMVRALLKNWKQPIFYKFDQTMSPDILMNIIKELFDIGLIVVSIVSDMELTLAHKLTKHHLEVTGSERQRVRPAVQLFSNSTAKAITYLGQNGFLPENSNWQDVSELCQLFNDWFDLLNSRNKYSGCIEKNAFGTNLEAQQDLLNRVTNQVSSMIVGNHKSMIQFQKGILLTNKSMAELYTYVHLTYGVEYILTSRLNQDVLENFFSYIRGIGGANDHPSPLEFRYRLRWYILGKNSATIFTLNTNTEDTLEPCLLKALERQSQNEVTEELCLTNNILSNLGQNMTISTENEPDDLEESMLKACEFIDPPYNESQYELHILDPEDENRGKTTDLLNKFEIKETVHEEALKYVAGYVAHRFRGKYDLGVETKNIEIDRKSQNWLSFISRGNLLNANENMLQATRVLDSEFNIMHGTSLSNGKHLFKTLAERTLKPATHYSVLRHFVAVIHEVLLSEYDALRRCVSLCGASPDFALMSVFERSIKGKMNDATKSTKRRS
ncbi:unnamed protein product [Callosobruchus maculatus]|uniref:THAP-type domain-containing protein n=1 Tax=Callosobruchus maculatus TaxID=64391 RepID=A0A653C7J8_CALMS|nr:unnamed protein product [Callosobruchus maculatus]